MTGRRCGVGDEEGGAPLHAVTSRRRGVGDEAARESRRRGGVWRRQQGSARKQLPLRVPLHLLLTTRCWICCLALLQRAVFPGFDTKAASSSLSSSSSTDKLVDPLHPLLQRALFAGVILLNHASFKPFTDPFTLHWRIIRPRNLTKDTHKVHFDIEIDYNPTGVGTSVLFLKSHH